MNFYCRECETELKKDECCERYNPEKEVIVCFCPNTECEKFDVSYDERELIESYAESERENNWRKEE